MTQTFGIFLASNQTAVVVDYTPTFIAVGGTLLAAAFTSVLAQYFFAPWLEVRKEILIDAAKDRHALACEVRDFTRHLRKLEMVTKAFTGTKRFEQHWQQAISEYQDALEPKKQGFNLSNLELKKPVANLGVAAGWTILMVSYRKTSERAPVSEAIRICHHFEKSISPTTLPFNRWRHARRGLRIFIKMNDRIKDLPFGE